MAIPEIGFIDCNFLLWVEAQVLESDRIAFDSWSYQR